MPIYKSSSLPPLGPTVIIDPKKSAKSVEELEILDEKLHNARATLIKLELEIQEAEARAAELRKDILIDVKKEIKKMKEEAEKEAQKTKEEAENIKKAAEQEAERIKSQAVEEADKIRKEANDVLEEAKEEVKRIVSETVARTKEQAEDIKTRVQESSFNTGREEGYKVGYKEAKQKCQELLNRIEEVLAEAKKEKERIAQKAQEEMSEEIVELAIMAAKKIVKTEITSNRNIIIQNIKEALNKIQTHGKVTIRVNLSDLQYLQDIKDDFLSLATGLKEIEFKEDPNIDPGGCKIDTNLGTIDATISTQMEKLEQELRSK